VDKVCITCGLPQKPLSKKITFVIEKDNVYYQKR